MNRISYLALLLISSLSISMNAQPVIHNHYHGQTSSGSLLKNVLFIGCTCALVYGAYDYFFRDSKKMLATLKTVKQQGEQLKETILEKTNEIKAWVTQEVQEDGKRTRSLIADLQTKVDQLTLKVDALNNRR